MGDVELPPRPAAATTSHSNVLDGPIYQNVLSFKLADHNFLSFHFLYQKPGVSMWWSPAFP